VKKCYVEIKRERNILQKLKKGRATGLGLFCEKNVIDEKIEVRIEVLGRRGRRCKQLLDGLNERRQCWKLKEEAADRTLWRTRFGKD
jgi:hypothetical protein